MPRGPLPPKFAGRGPRPFGSFLGSGLAPAAINRYFRTNDGSNDYISIPEVTFSGDFEIESLFYFDGTRSALFGNSVTFDSRGLVDSNGSINFRPTSTGLGEISAPAGSVIVNTLNLIKFQRTGTVCEILLNGVQVASGNITVADCVTDEFCRSGGFSNMSGILANVLMYDNGTLVRNYPINDNSNIIADISGNGQDGSVVNGNASDWELFNQQADGDYLGQELATSSVSPVLGDTSDPEFFPVASIIGGNEYRISATVLTFSGSSDCGWTTTATGGVSNGIPATPPFRATTPSIGDTVGGDFVSTSGPDVRLFGRVSAVCSFNNLTIKRLLRVA